MLFAFALPSFFSASLFHLLCMSLFPECIYELLFNLSSRASILCSTSLHPSSDSNHSQVCEIEKRRLSSFCCVSSHLFYPVQIYPGAVELMQVIEEFIHIVGLAMKDFHNAYLMTGNLGKDQRLLTRRVHFTIYFCLTRTHNPCALLTPRASFPRRH